MVNETTMTWPLKEANFGINHLLIHTIFVYSYIYTCQLSTLLLTEVIGVTCHKRDVGFNLYVMCTLSVYSVERFYVNQS